MLEDGSIRHRRDQYVHARKTTLNDWFTGCGEPLTKTEGNTPPRHGHKVPGRARRIIARRGMC